MLTKTERIKHRGLFTQAHEKGKVLSSRLFRVCYTKTLEQYKDNLPLVGCVVGKKFCKQAVTRNKIRRRFREVYRLFRLNPGNTEKLKKIGLLIISVKGKYEFGDLLYKYSYTSIKADLEYLLNKLL